jgi:hypothetical protein
MLKKIRWAISFSLVIIGFSLLVWVTLPSKHQMDIKQFHPAERSISIINGYSENFALLEARQLSLEWSPLLRIGDKSVISLSFDKIEGEPTSVLAAGFVNIYDRYNIMAEARIEVAGLKVEPFNTIRESMPAGQSVRIKWEISTDQAGIYDGRVWLSLRLLPLDGSPSIEMPYYVSDIKMRTTNVLGLSGAVTRLLGGAGILIGVMLGFNDIIFYVRRLMHNNTLTNATDIKGK